MNRYIRANMALCSSGDAWGDTMGAWFDIADILHCDGAEIPPDWQYRRGSTLAEDHCREESLFFADTLDDWREGAITADDLRHVGNVLARYSSILRAQGRDY